ncbi:hypothetical protein GOP47_0025453 [Adiantum capillus-veneris]|uniref:Protein root UVB sensitive 2, chloroplastic n=1 Tax=Adiantum capillus-veneris TaxID=13818 RepID=A0A9D4U0E8_ADICA|nr:hypothetical protein GOP47_0025453 [Adiantum capillus-veneris]
MAILVEYSASMVEQQEQALRWVEQKENVRQEFSFGGPALNVLCTRTLKDERPLPNRMVESFLNRFFPLGYPHSVSEGYLTYSQFRALQHFSSAMLSVFSTQSLLYAAGLRPTPAQATVVSWVLKDGMQHAGKIACSMWGARMDAEPKRWRLLADALYDLGTALEVVSPLCPHLFLEVAGIANLAKGMATVAARATRLPIYSGFAKEGNLSDLYAKGEAISTLFNVLGLGVGIRLASTVCSTMHGKLVAAPLLSAVHLFSIAQEMRAAPLNTLNSQRTACIIAEFVKTGNVPTPAEIRYKERLALPVTLNVEAGSVVVGVSIRRAFGKPSVLKTSKAKIHEERFLLSFHDRQTHMVLHRNASGEDVVKGWLLSAYVARIAGGKSKPMVQSSGVQKMEAMEEAYELTDKSFPILISGLREAGWHTDLFLEGGGERAVW